MAELISKVMNPASEPGGAGGLRRLQDYVRQAAAQVKSLLVQNNLPTDLQLHCYMRELVKALARLTAGAPEALRRAVAQPFEAVWDFQENKPLNSQLKVDHLVYVLEFLESLLLAGHEIMGAARRDLAL